MNWAESNNRKWWELWLIGKTDVPSKRAASVEFQPIVAMWALGGRGLWFFSRQRRFFMWCLMIFSYATNHTSLYEWNKSAHHTYSQQPLVWNLFVSFSRIFFLLFGSMVCGPLSCGWVETDPFLLAPAELLLTLCPSPRCRCFAEHLLRPGCCGRHFLMILPDSPLSETFIHFVCTIWLVYF